MSKDSSKNTSMEAEVRQAPSHSIPDTAPLPALTPASSVDWHYQTTVLRQRAKAIHELLQGYMVGGTHYGPAWPGSDRPVLLKAGAEAIAALCRLRAHVEVTKTELGDMDREYLARVSLHNLAGEAEAMGVGSCSTLEERHAWRDATAEEWAATPEESRRVKTVKKRNGGVWERQQVRQHPADKWNSVLKIAKKRAFVDAVLMATGASAVFTQDFDDDPDDPDDPDGQTETPDAEPTSSEGGNRATISAAQLRTLKGALERHGVSVKLFELQFGCTPAVLPFDRLNEALQWAGSKGEEN